MVKNEQRDFNIEECRLKHELINKDINATNVKIEDFFEEIINHQKELKEEINKLGDYLQSKFEKEIQASNDSLKNKIILTEKSIGEKIDILDDTVDSFDSDIKGNGEPGLKEKVRLLEAKIKWNFLIIGVLVLLVFGGEFWGVTKSTIHDYFFHSKINEVITNDKTVIDEIDKNVDKETGEMPVIDKKPQ